MAKEQTCTWSLMHMNILIHWHYCTSILYTLMDIHLYYNQIQLWCAIWTCILRRQCSLKRATQSIWYCVFYNWNTTLNRYLQHNDYLETTLLLLLSTCHYPIEILPNHIFKPQLISTDFHIHIIYAILMRCCIVFGAIVMVVMCTTVVIVRISHIAPIKDTQD